MSSELIAVEMNRNGTGWGEKINIERQPFASAGSCFENQATLETCHSDPASPTDRPMQFDHELPGAAQPQPNRNNGNGHPAVAGPRRHINQTIGLDPYEPLVAFGGFHVTGRKCTQENIMQ
jgi:hypothetical protein